MIPVSALAVALVVTATGLVDAFRHRDTDLAIVFVTLLLLQAGALIAWLRGRRGVALRPDLASWLRRQATATGEPVERLADRSVAAYRAGLVDDPQPVP